MSGKKPLSRDLIDTHAHFRHPVNLHLWTVLVIIWDNNLAFGEFITLGDPQIV